MLCRYLLELVLIDYNMIKYVPSMLASAAVYLVNIINQLCFKYGFINRLTNCSKTKLLGEMF